MIVAKWAAGRSAWCKVPWKKAEAGSAGRVVPVPRTALPRSIHLLRNPAPDLRDRRARGRSIMCDEDQTQEELAKSRAVLRAAIDCLPFNFFAIGLDGRYMLQNAVSRAQHRADVVGKRPEEVCPNEHDLAIWLDNNRRAFAGEKVEGEVTLSLEGGERLYHNIIAPIRDGEELYGILGVNIDITETQAGRRGVAKGPRRTGPAGQGAYRRTDQGQRRACHVPEVRATASGQGFSMADTPRPPRSTLNPGAVPHAGRRMAQEASHRPALVRPLSGAVQSPGEATEIEPACAGEGHWRRRTADALDVRGNPIPHRGTDSFLIRDELKHIRSVFAVVRYRHHGAQAGRGGPAAKRTPLPQLLRAGIDRHGGDLGGQTLAGGQ